MKTGEHGMTIPEPKPVRDVDEAAPTSGRWNTLAKFLVELEPMNEDESEVCLAVALAVAKRINLGRQRYGELDLDSDERDLPLETLEETLDAPVYLTSWMIQRQRRQDG